MPTTRTVRSTTRSQSQGQPPPPPQASLDNTRRVQPKRSQGAATAPAQVVEEEKSESGSEGDSSDEVAANLTSPAKGTATRRGRAPAAALSESDDAGGDEPDAPQEEEPAEEESGEEALSEAVVSQKDLLAGDASHAQSSGEGNAVVVVAQTRKRAKNVYSSAAKKKSDAAGRVAREDEPRSPAAPAARSVVARSPTKRRKAPSDDEYDELESSDADDSEEIPPERDPWNGDEDLADVLANAPDGVLFLRWNSSKSRPARFWLPPKELWPLKEDMEQSWVDSPHYEYRDSETGVRNVIEEYKSTVVAHEDMTKADFVVVPPGLASRHPKKYLDYTNLAKDYRIPVLSSLFIAESVRDADQAVEDNTKVRLRDYQKYILQPPNPNTGPRERFTSDDANKLAKAIHKRNGNRPRAFEHLAKKTHSSKSWKNFYTTRKRDIDRMVDDFARERWEDAKIDPEPQLFALAADLKRVVNRLAAVEGFLQTLPAELRVGAPRPQRISPMFGGGDAPDAYSPDNLPLSTPQGREDPEMHNNSDTEEAAVNLEAAAFGPQRTVGFLPADSLPFLDTRAPKSTRTYRAELTRELTSIVAPAINLEAGWSCSVQLGLDFGIAPEDVEAARKEAVAKVLLCFPDKTTSYFLVAQYFEDFDWIHHTVHQPSFQAELDRFWEMHAQGRESDVDPLWLSLYAMILALSLDGMRTRPQSRLEGRRDSASQALKWSAAAQRLLVLGDWLGTPQARSIMTIILLGQYIQISSFGGQANRFLVWLSSAIRIAQVMGLHQLGDNPEAMPPEDPAWPPGKNSVKREGALRIFGIVVFMDWLAATTRFPCYMLHTSQFNTAPVSNLNDSDLSTTEWRTNPLPRNIVTDASFEYAKFVMALQSRKVFDKLVSESETFSYHTVMELDREYRQVLDRLPDEWKTEHAQKEKKHPQLRWKRHVCQEGIHSRIVRLHRPFLTRGYTAGSRFRYSTEQCVASARIVISTHHNILDVTNNVWFLYSHALGAAIVLFCDLFHAIDSDYPEAEVENKKETLVAAFEIFGRGDSISSPVLRAVVQQGARILSGLFMAEEKRRVTRLINDGKPHTVESFAQVLQRISSSLDFKVPEDIEQSAAEVLATLPAFAGTPSNGMGSATPFPSVHPGDDPNIDHLSSMFYQDLGMPQGGGSGASFWQTSNVEDVNGPTPPDTYSFLGTQIDWANIGMNQQPSGAPLDANALAATALLDQMSLPW